MRLTETFEALLQITDLQTVVDVASIQAINATTEATEAEWRGDDSFRARVELLFSQLADGDLIRARRAMDLLLVCAEYEDRRSLAGVGGCVVKSLEELIGELPGDAPAPFSPIR